MARKLVNVRLDESRLRKVRRLRASGVPLTDIVRDAIDSRYDALTHAITRDDASAVVQRILAAHPDPVDLPARDYDVHDRAAARQAIKRSVGRRSRDDH